MKSTIPPGYFDLRRASALLTLGHLELARNAAWDAVLANPDDSQATFLYLELLRRTDPERALSEAEKYIESPRLAADVAAACINILSAHADHLSGAEFTDTCRRILDWCERFEHAHDRVRVHAGSLALVRFDEGLAHLGLGNSEEARRCFQEAHRINPVDPAFGEAVSLSAYGGAARRIAEAVRSQSTPIAA